MEITSVPEAEQFHWWGNRREVLRRFYTKYLNVEGIAIIGCDNVPDNAFYRAKDIILKLTSKHLQFRSDLFGNSVHACSTGDMDLGTSRIVGISRFTVRVCLYITKGNRRFLCISR